jgi:PII-like signaling protein
MTLETTPAVRLTILIGEDDQWQHRPLYDEIIRRAHAAGLAGASVFRGVEGYGANNHIHTTRILSLSEDMPVAIMIVDREPSVREFVAGLRDLRIEGSITLEPVEVVRLTPPDAG